MGVAINNFASSTEDRASGAQVIDGSLLFDSSQSQVLHRTPSGAGNQKTWTWSAWVKRVDFGSECVLFSGSASAGANYYITFSGGTGTGTGADGLSFFYGYGIHVGTAAATFRDTGWYHVVVALDTTQSTTSDRVKIYVNGTEVTYSYTNYPSENADLGINSSYIVSMGAINSYASWSLSDMYLSQVNFIDGQALDSSYFGFTDPLTNTWRPKKYSGTFGTNGFYLPMDGNSPIGFDKSGNGNDWTPKNFGGTVGLDKATGALPILNTNGGGSVANAGVRTDAYAANLVLALPLVGGTTNDLSNSINSTTTTKTITKNGDPSVNTTSSNFYSNSLDFDASGDYLSSSSSTDFAFGTGDFTIEYWANYDDVSTASQKGDFQTSDTSGGLKTTYTSGILASFGSHDGSYRVNINSSNVLTASGYTTGIWYHNAITREGSTLRLFRNGILQATASNSTDFSSSTYLAVGGYYNTSYLINGRLQDFRIYKGVAKYTSNFLVGSASPDTLPDTPSGVATKTKLTKINEGSVEFDGTNDYMTVASGAGFAFGTGDFSVECYAYSNSRGTNDYIIDGRNGSQTSGTWSLGYGYAAGNGRLEFATGSSTILECPANLNPEAKQWHHIVVTRSGSTNRMFIDGVLAASATDSTNFSTEPTTSTIGARYSTQHLYDGFISNIRVVKGSIPTEYQTSSTTVGAKIFTSPTSQLTNVTNTTLLCCHDPLSSVGSIVTPGNITAYGAAAGNTFNPFNTDVNTIRGQETRYCTMNPLSIGDGTPPTLSNGNLTVKANTTTFSRTNGDTYATSGKFYAEVTKISGQTTDDSIGIGAATYQALQSTNPYIGRTSDSYGFYGAGQKIHNNTITGSYSDSWGQLGDVMGILMDLDNGTVSLTINGIDQGIAYTGIDASLGWTFCVAPYNNQEHSLNFGQKPFKFTPPDGFQALTGSILRPEKVIPDGTKFIAAVPYAGNSATNKITTGFAPDFVWIKNRTNAYAHCLFDTVRGAGKRLESDATYGEDDYNLLNTFNDNGFTLGVQGGGGAFVQNTTGTNSMSWSWKAGGNKNTFNIDDVGYASAAAAGLDGGSTNPTGASVNTKSKFGIYTFDGNSSNRTMSHGLGQQPDFMICKKKSTSGNSWVVWHSDIANTEYILLNSTAGKATDATLFNSHASDSSTLWTIGSNTTFNETGQSSVAYLWCDVPGLQKFGKFTGNGNSSGPYVELGFSPSILIIKDTSGNDWYIYDNERSSSKPLFPNGTYSEQPDDRPIDFLSNGFKIRYNQFFNGSSSTMIYAAWAEAPSFNMYGASSNARVAK